jgi:hypothetical protein
MQNKPMFCTQRTLQQAPPASFHLWSKGNGFEHLGQLWKNAEESFTII